LRPEQAEEPHAQARRSVFTGIEAFKRGGCEIQFRHLPQAQRLLRWPQGLAQPWPLWMQGLHAPQHREEVVLARPGLQALEQRGQLGVAPGRVVHTVSCRPVRGGQRITSPRCGVRSVSWVKLLMAACRAKKRSSTLANMKALVPW